MTGKIDGSQEYQFMLIRISYVKHVIARTMTHVTILPFLQVLSTCGSNQNQQTRMLVYLQD